MKFNVSDFFLFPDASQVSSLCVYSDIYAWPLVRANLPLSELLPIPGRLPSPATVTLLLNDLEKDGWNLAFTMLVVRHADNAVLYK